MALEEFGENIILSPSQYERRINSLVAENNLLKAEVACYEELVDKIQLLKSKI
jgi:hypothetical protein